MFAYNVATIASPLNPYLASRSVITNPGRMAQPQGGVRYVPLGIPILTTNSLVSMRQQMDERNQGMVNMLTQHISIVFHPLIQNTTQSYQQLAHMIGRIVDFLGTKCLSINLH